ncbi:MAG: T9SS type A sorting domain-containing protein [Bacteroidales bacterium]|nr:T9SS type A sorting domain-containing protein [Bacteroidales bacterium]
MKKNFLFTLCALLIGSFIITQTYAQKENPPAGYEKLTPLSVKDSIELANLPKLTLPESFKGPDAPLLPYIVDNSQNIHWRPVFAQVAYECGQASGIGLGYTYAINRLRNLPSNDPDNQYPTHFCWNFGNGGDGYYGVSYFHSFEIIKTEGTPNVTTYGGMSAGGPRRWMNEYDNYYQAMHNRLAEAFQIDVSTEEGVLTLRHWIDNHLEGSDVGGVANFYTSCPYGMPTLPSGTPEAGMYVMTSWSSANHGLTVSGYHDSICWDYNNDGQYTNHIDINGDGVVNVRDWEIGGLRFANTYSGGPNFGNNGFCYMMYKTLADPYGNGGIWDNAVHVLYAKAGTEPLLTAKITLKHIARKMIRVRIGYSTDTTAFYPECTIGFPIFNFQGGNYYMQGGTSEEDKTIEFGLDITPIINMIGSGVPARYFLMVDEDDPSSWGLGEIIDFSIIDYTNGINEIICDQSNVNLVNNGLTKLWVNHTVEYNNVFIDNDTLPVATVYEPYTCQLTASGGTEPYLWDFDLNFTETNYTQTFPMVNAQQLTPSNNDDGYALKQLDFTFPFYGEEYDEVRVNVDGTIMFENYFDWPYTVYDFFTFTKNKHIAPFYTDLRIYPSGNDGMWYEGGENSATFRWKVSVNGQPGTTELNFAVTLYKNGNIKFYYGNVNDYTNIEWLSGLSAGDNKYYQFTEVTNDPSITPEFVCDLEASHHPEEFEVSRYGIFSGTPQKIYNNFEIKFRVTDENNLTNSKILLFSTDGSNYLVVDDYTVVSGGDDIIEFGETTYLSVSIKSLGVVTITGAEMLISINDEYVTMNDSIEILGNFEPGEIKTFTDAFIFDVGNLVPNEHELDFNTLITDDSGGEWTSHIYLTAYAPEISAGSVTVDDGGNGGLDPGETADLIVTLVNDGGATANNIVATLFSDDPYITINNNTGNINILNPYNNDTVTFNVTASDEIPIGYILEFTVDIEADNDYTASDQVYVIVGLICEDFETGNFSAYPWQFGGNAEWMIDDSIMFEGNYSARSGDIDDEQTSDMLLEVCVLSDGEIGFYKKVSSEATYDFLRFYINGIEKGAWEGEQDWSISTYPISAGVHTLKWSYEKDMSISNGSDCGWVDNITFPPFGDPYPQLTYNPETFVLTLESGEIVTDTITIMNEGTGPIIFSVEVVDSLGNSVDWLSVDQQNGGLNPATGDTIEVTFDATGLEQGNYMANIIITDHLDNEYIIPVWMYVEIIPGIGKNNYIARFETMPNPFSDKTQIRFEVKKSGKLTLDIFNFKGSKIKTLIPGLMLNKGSHTVIWDATNQSGNRVKPGIYFYKLTFDNEVLTGKMIFMD